MEEEVVLGTILATMTQPRWRADRANHMRVHSGALVRYICEQIFCKAKQDEPTMEELWAGLLIAWEMWWCTEGWHGGGGMVRRGWWRQKGAC